MSQRIYSNRYNNSSEKKNTDKYPSYFWENLNGGFDSPIWYLNSLNSFTSNDYSENQITSECDQNEINQQKLEELNNKITPLFLSLLEYEDFQFGISSKAENLIREQLELNSFVALTWINSLYIKNFKNEKILKALIYIIGNLTEEEISATGKTIALASLSHKSDEIKEYGIRAFENWASLESFETLSNLKVESAWLQNYINQIVEDLKIELCLFS